MSVLLISDLSTVHDLDAKAMNGIRGGFALAMPATELPMLQLEQPKLLVDAAQSLGQGQTALVNNGNNAAFIGPSVEQRQHQRRESSTMRNEVNF